MLARFATDDRFAEIRIMVVVFGIAFQFRRGFDPQCIEFSEIYRAAQNDIILADDTFVAPLLGNFLFVQSGDSSRKNEHGLSFSKLSDRKDLYLPVWTFDEILQFYSQLSLDSPEICRLIATDTSTSFVNRGTVPMIFAALSIFYFNFFFFFFCSFQCLFAELFWKDFSLGVDAFACSMMQLGKKQHDQCCSSHPWITSNRILASPMSIRRYLVASCTWKSIQILKNHILDWHLTFSRSKLRNVVTQKRLRICGVF
jgi:hypothetical protein